jgi:hypothetical protein
MKVRQFTVFAATAGALLFITGCTGSPRAVGATLGVTQDKAEGACRSDIVKRINEIDEQESGVTVSISTPTFYDRTREAGAWTLTGEVHVDLNAVLASASRDVTFKCNVDRLGRASTYTAGLN